MIMNEENDRDHSEEGDTVPVVVVVVVSTPSRA